MKRIKRSLLALVTAGLLVSLSALPSTAANALDMPQVMVDAKWDFHVQYEGSGSKSDRADLVSGVNTLEFTLGTVGKSLRLEHVSASRIRIQSDVPKVISSADCYVRLQGHVQNIGWQSVGYSAGTMGQGLRMEAVKMWSTCSNVKIRYQAHVQNIGWMGWQSEGATAGTVGRGLRIEALRISLEFPNLRYIADAIRDGDCKLAGLC